MASISRFKEEFLNYCYAKQIEIFNFISDTITNKQTQKLSLKEASEILKEFYETDEELTAFQSIDSDFNKSTHNINQFIK